MDYNNNRLNQLLELKILIKRGKFIRLNKTAKKFAISSNVMNELHKFNGNFLEKIYRYLTNDELEHICPVCKFNRLSVKSLSSGFRINCSNICVRENIRQKYPKGKGTFLGKKHSDETKNKMRENHADFSGDKNPYRNALLKDPGKRQEASNRAKERWKNYTIEDRRRISYNFSKAQANANNGGIGRGHIRGDHYSDKLIKGKMHFRSSWEEMAAILLDENTNVINYNYESIVFPYKHFTTEKMHHARMDFEINLFNGETLILEIKPFCMAEINIHIIFAQQEYCLLESIQYILLDNTFLNTKSFDLIINSALSGEFYVDKILNSKTTTMLDYIKKEGFKFLIS